jgi:23S rRNA (cytidine1920-2'-O)/16S rRNA (cytidine1409-2'-O)-methyltransferase
VPSGRRRLDAELVRRGLARSREQAADLIAASRVHIGGVAARKAATAVHAETSIRVTPLTDGADYASRGGYKLAGALDTFSGIVVAGRRCLDAGASTGGFTDVLLRRGAAGVVAVDVGYGQLAWSLRNDPRVRVIDRTNVRSLTPALIGGAAQLTVADLSFISLSTVLPALAACTDDSGDLVPMVKPQFEVGRDRLGRGGVVRDPADRVDAVVAVVRAAEALGWRAVGVTPSGLPGPAGNVEFFLWLRRSTRTVDQIIDRAAIERAAGTTREDHR